jgi:hypothetical protein
LSRGAGKARSPGSEEAPARQRAGATRQIETAYFELKSTILAGWVLRARTPPGVAQEIYALLVTCQALRIAISDAVLTRPDVDPDRASFSIALNAARDQLIAAQGVLTDTAPNAIIDLAGELGRQVLDHLMPARRSRTNPRVVKRAIRLCRKHRPWPRPRAQPQNRDHYRHPQRAALTRPGMP